MRSRLYFPGTPAASQVSSNTMRHAFTLADDLAGRRMDEYRGAAMPRPICCAVSQPIWRSGSRVSPASQIASA
jgi:hypothetical protein